MEKRMSNKLISSAYSLWRGALPATLRWKLAPRLARLFPGLLASATASYMEASAKKVKQPFLVHIQTWITRHCNLNCKYCQAFSPIAEERYVDKASYVRDFTRLSELTGGKIERIHIQGGEPLLHPELLDLLRETRRLFKGSLIFLVTNGILLPKQTEYFWRTCKKENILVYVSHYPINIHYESLKKAADKYGVKMTYDFPDSVDGGGGG
jgi:sulfatase maturation enzyme AslB (radical SAM superfamily)